MLPAVKPDSVTPTLPLAPLSAVQLWIVEQLAGDREIQEIADSIDLSVETVRYHLGELRWKLRARHKAGIVGAFLRLPKSANGKRN